MNVRCILTLLVLAGGLAGCGSIEPLTPIEPPVTDPAQLYMELRLDHPAVNLSTAAGYNTLQLAATPLDALGNPMTGLGAPTYRSTDTSVVRVTADGLVTALATVNQVYVVATLTAGSVTRIDTARIKVRNIASPPALAAVSIHPVPPDSGIGPVPSLSGEGGIIYAIYQDLGLLSPVVPMPRATDAGDNAIADLQFAYTSLDPDVAKIDRWDGYLIPSRPGQVRIVAQTTAYGILKADTATFTLTMPTNFQIYIGLGGAPRFSMPSGASLPSEIRIAPYGIVGWLSELGDSVDVIFDDQDPAHVATAPDIICNYLTDNLGPEPFCGTGDIIVPSSDTATWGDFAVFFTLRFRQFPGPGVYNFHSTRLGTGGRIVVTNGPE